MSLPDAGSSKSSSDRPASGGSGSGSGMTTVVGPQNSGGGAAVARVEAMMSWCRYSAVALSAAAKELPVDERRGRGLVRSSRPIIYRVRQDENV